MNNLNKSSKLKEEFENTAAAAKAARKVISRAREATRKLFIFSLDSSRVFSSSLLSSDVKINRKAEIEHFGQFNLLFVSFFMLQFQCKDTNLL